MCLTFAEVNAEDVFGDKQSITVYKIMTKWKDIYCGPYFGKRSNGVPIDNIVNHTYISSRSSNGLNYYEKAAQHVDEGIHVFLDLESAQRELPFIVYGCIFKCVAERADYVAHRSDLPTESHPIQQARLFL
jgi:hypothetical protein